MLMGKAVIYVTGIVLVSIALIGYVIPVDEGYSIPEVVALCSTDMGQLGQAFSGDIVKACSEFNVFLMGVYGFGISGAVLMIVGAIIPESSKKNTSLDILKERYAKGDITKEEFDKMKKDLT